MKHDLDNPERKSWTRRMMQTSDGKWILCYQMSAVFRSGHDDALSVQLRTKDGTTELEGPPRVIEAITPEPDMRNYKAVIGDQVVIVKDGKTIYAGPIADMPCQGCEHPPHVGRVCGHPLFETFRDDVGIFAPPSGMKITDIVGTCQCEFESEMT